MSVFYERGNYVCRIIEQGFQEASTGKPMLVFKVLPIFRAVRGPDGEEQLDPTTEQYERMIRLVIDGANEQMMDYAMRKLRYAGFQGDSFADLDMVDVEVRCTCGSHEYQDNEYEDWDLALPPLESAVLEPLDAKVARKLDALFGKRLKNGGAAKPQKSQAKPQPQWTDIPGDAAETVPPRGAPPPKDEIPF